MGEDRLEEESNYDATASRGLFPHFFYLSLYMIFSNDLLVQLMIDLFLISFAFWLLRTFYFSMFYVMYSTILYTGFTLLRVCTLKEWRSVLIGLMLVDLYLFIALWSWIHEKKLFYFFHGRQRLYTHMYTSVLILEEEEFFIFSTWNKVLYMIEFWYFFNSIKSFLRSIYHSLIIYFRHFNILCNIIK